MSVASDAFVFVHLQKCGGTHIERILTTHFGACPLPLAVAETCALLSDDVTATEGKEAPWQHKVCKVCSLKPALFGWEDHCPLWCQDCKVSDALLVGRPKHSPFSRLNGDARPVIGAIRNPFSLYVSLFAYGVKGRGRIRKDIAVALGDAACDKLYADAMDIDAFRKWLPIAIGDPDLGLVTRRFADLYVVGASTALALAMKNNETKSSKNQGVPSYADVKENAIGFVRQECLEESLLGLLQNHCGVEVLPKTRHDIMGMGKTWTSAHRPYEQYYDYASQQLVANADRWVLDRFGYRFGM